MSSPIPPPSLKWAALAGSVSALLCAAGWGAVLGFWGLRSAMLGVSVGIFVGLAVRVAGRRSDLRVMLLGGGFAAWSCLLGNVVGFTIAEARGRGLTALETIVILGSHGGEWLAQDAMRPLSLVACLLAGIAGAMVACRGSDPGPLLSLLGAAGGVHVMPRTGDPPDDSPARMRPPPPAERKPVVEKRLPMRQGGKPGEGGTAG